MCDHAAVWMPLMTVKFSSLASTWLLALLVALGVLGFSAFASADPEVQPERDDGSSAAPNPKGASPESEARLVAQLRAIEASRRELRKQALEDPQAWAAKRAARATEHRQQIAQLWGSVVGIIDARASLRINADRMARFNRMLDLAEAKGDTALVARLQADITRELVRHVRAMQHVQALSGSQ